MTIENEEDLALIQNVKMSKEGQLLVIPLVKNHLFGNGEFSTVEFVMFDATTLKMWPQKL